MIEKVKVPRKVYNELMIILREVHYSEDYPVAIKKAEDNGFFHTAEWLKDNEAGFKSGFARGFEPQD
jgi:hypothetical protein